MKIIKTLKVTYTGLYKVNRVTITRIAKNSNMEPYTYVVGDAIDEVGVYKKAINNLGERLKD